MILDPVGGQRRGEKVYSSVDVVLVVFAEPRVGHESGSWRVADARVLDAS